MTDRTDVWTYASANSVTVPTDLTITYYTGLKVKLTQTTEKYFRIESSSYAAGTGLTTIHLNGFGIYTVANTPITAHSDMVAENPVGFPLGFEGSGRSGGQTITGGIASGDDLTLRSTSNGTKGDIIFGTSKYDEANNRLGIARTPATYPLEVQGDVYVTGNFQGNLVGNVTGDVTGTSSGNVVGPTSATDGNLALFDGITGKLLKDSTSSPASFAASAHNHAGTDITSSTIDGDRLPAISTTKKGGVPATGTPSGKFLKDDGNWDVPAYSVGGNDSVVYVENASVIAKTAFGIIIEDGTLGTDDAAVIQAAIDVGGAVLLAYSLFTIESPLVISDSGVRLYAGSRSVTLKAKNALNDNIIEITGNGICRVTLSNLYIDGNKANQSSGKAIYINTPYATEDANHLLENIFIKDVKDDGIHIEGDTRNCKLDNVVVLQADASGIILAGSDHILYDVSVGACKCGGFNISAGSIKATSCKAFFCGETQGDGIYVVGDRGTYIACEAQDNYLNGWMFDGAENCILTNCIADSNSQWSTAQKAGVCLSNAVKILLAHCACMDRQVTATQYRGVYVTGTSDGCVTTYSIYDRNVSTTYLDDSSGTNHEVIAS